MHAKLFHILKGNNGATYICNAKNTNSIIHSLKFYKARSFKATVLKQGLQAYLLLKGFFLKGSLESATEINQYLQKIAAVKTDFNINKNCSVLISPTTDKVIVNHHNNYFQKFAFGKSYNNVKKEAAIYALFTEDTKYFQTSKFYDVIDNKDQIITFKLSNKHILTKKAVQTTINLVPALLEFFNISKQNSGSIKKQVSVLKTALQQLSAIETGAQQQVLETINTNYGALEFPLGLVHRDFKPWNVLSYAKPLIFDFEETVTNGLPLEDLLNYYIDPIIRYKTTQEVVNLALSKTQIISYKNYLAKLTITIDFKVFLHFYLIERILFWSDANEEETARRYKKLSDHLILAY